MTNELTVTQLLTQGLSNVHSLLQAGLFVAANQNEVKSTGFQRSKQAHLK